MNYGCICMRFLCKHLYFITFERSLEIQTQLSYQLEHFAVRFQHFLFASGVSLSISNTTVLNHCTCSFKKKNDNKIKLLLNKISALTGHVSSCCFYFLCKRNETNITILSHSELLMNTQRRHIWFENANSILNCISKKSTKKNCVCTCRQFYLKQSGTLQQVLFNLQLFENNS